MSWSSNAGEIARLYRARATQLTAALARGLRRAAALVDREQVERLSGARSAPTDGLPVAVRTGNLRRATFFAVRTARLALVGNTAAYAAAVHGGMDGTVNVPAHRRGAHAVAAHRRRVKRPAREFLAEAVTAARPTAVVAAEVRQTVMAL